MLTSTLTTKGQATIPKAIRDQLGLKPGSRLAFGLSPAGECVLLAAGASGESELAARRLRLEQALAALRPDQEPLPQTTDAVLAMLRGEEN